MIKAAVVQMIQAAACMEDPWHAGAAGSEGDPGQAPMTTELPKGPTPRFPLHLAKYVCALTATEHSC